MLLGMEIVLIGEYMITLNSSFSLIVKDILLPKSLVDPLFVEIVFGCLPDFSQFPLWLENFFMKLSNDWWSFLAGVILLQKSFLIL